MSNDYEPKEYVGKVATCDICGKRKIIVSQRNQVRSFDGHIDTYVECIDCSNKPL